jgi:hypothetical protein
MFSPVVTLSIGHGLRSIKHSEWSKLLRSREMLRSASVAYGALQNADEREAFAKDALGEFFRQFEFAERDELLEQMIAVFAKAFSQPDDFTSPGSL